MKHRRSLMWAMYFLSCLLAAAAGLTLFPEGSIEALVASIYAGTAVLGVIIFLRKTTNNEYAKWHTWLYFWALFFITGVLVAMALLLGFFPTEGNAWYLAFGYVSSSLTIGLLSLSIQLSKYIDYVRLHSDIGSYRKAKNPWAVWASAVISIELRLSEIHGRLSQALEEKGQKREVDSVASISGEFSRLSDRRTREALKVFWKEMTSEI